MAEGAEPASGGAATIKVGCLSWCFHSLGPAADPEPAIDIIGEMGFDGIELIVTARKDLQTFWTDARIDRLKQKLDGHKLRVSQFAMFQPVVEGLSSTQRDVRDQALDYFEGGCRIARKFESPLINIVAPWALELKGPTRQTQRAPAESAHARHRRHDAAVPADRRWSDGLPDADRLLEGPGDAVLADALFEWEGVELGRGRGVVLGVDNHRAAGRGALVGRRCRPRGQRRQGQDYELHSQKSHGLTELIN